MKWIIALLLFSSSCSAQSYCAPPFGLLCSRTEMACYKTHDEAMCDAASQQQAMAGVMLGQALSYNAALMRQTIEYSRESEDTFYLSQINERSGSDNFSW